MRHTFRREPYHRICFTAEMVAQDVVFRFFHWGDFFEPAAISAPDLSEFPEGGFGLFLVKQSVDTLTFSQDPGGRCCTELRLCLRKPESAGNEQKP
jgi:anti-sigma regulatory factor (Ser/Thr protein kinase)